MLDLNTFNENFKKGKIHNCYIFFGTDEGLIKEHINMIIDKIVDPNFKDLNYIQFDGNNIENENAIVNACETMPFMSDKKIVVVYRANFLDDNEDKSNSKVFDAINSYIDNIPPHCILIMYYTMESKRDKSSKRLNKLDKKTCIVDTKYERKIKEEKLKGKICSMFEARGTNIGKIELQTFYNGVKESNLSIIESEVEKLCCYTLGRQIKKEDIKTLLLESSDEDIFDMVDFLAQRKINKALDILNSLLFRGEKVEGILFMVERQFKILVQLKIGMECGKNKDMLAKELRLHPYVCEKMMMQSKGFTLKQVKGAIDKCLETERKIKSSSINKKTEMELLLIRTITV